MIHNKLQKALRKLLHRRLTPEEATRILDIIEYQVRVPLHKVGVPSYTENWKPVFETFKDTLVAHQLVKEWFNVI